MKKVVNYDLRWNPTTDSGIIWVKFDDNLTKEVPVNSSAEFIAVALVLSKPPVIMRDDGTLECRG